ncbi:flavin reductase [Mesorhizobium retamae]|uniref:Flavin reductase n=1 Tax=Mesorhizobium retamae TaxID=2912854 RepID=A0ABS9QBZ0_9HYPH|nr:flavin reductase [Mesorhizobium sp. IRAMC:0171]MCG7504910.1 flavin reductase [Mesorhizobium sp. IRAMC:0171]
MQPQVSRLEFRDAMARVCAPVNIVTTDGPAGRGGFTATAMCSVSDDPPTLLICMNERSAQTGMFLENRRFCVNVLTQAHMHLASKFAGAIRDMAERYQAASWQTMPSGMPALLDAIVSFDCEIGDVNKVGTHNVMFGRVIDIRHGSGEAALLYVDRNYSQPMSLGSFGG